MNTIPELKESDLPADGLRFFHGLCNWVEEAKGSKMQFINWGKGEKKLSLINCIKPQKGEKFSVPDELSGNTLYVPISMSGLKAIIQLRHAFCHADLKYDEKSNQYRMELTDKVHIAGQFSLAAIREFVDIYLQPKNPKSKKIKKENSK